MDGDGEGPLGDASNSVNAVRDRLVMLAQDPRPMEEKGELIVREADAQITEWVQVGNQVIGDGMASNPTATHSKSQASANTNANANASGNLQGMRAEDGERDVSDEEMKLRRTVGEFTTLFQLVRMVSKLKGHQAIMTATRFCFCFRF